MHQWRRSYDHGRACSRVTEQQPGQGDQRLARISHHFLSEEPVQPRPAEHRHTRVITIAALPGRPFPTLALAAIMVRRGIDCTIREAGQSPIQLRPVDAGPAHEHRQQALRLAISHAPDGGSTDHTDMLLLAVPASATGLREGFIRLKRYLGVLHPPRVGVTLLDCDDPERARRHFGQLRQACRRFLATELNSYGAITSGHEAIGDSAELGGIARLLTDDLGLDIPATARTGPATGEGSR